MCLVIAWALVGPAASSAASLRAARLEVLVLEDAVDDAPALHLLGAEDPAGHHELAGAAAAGALGEPLGPAHRRASARRLSRPGRTWPSGAATIRSQASASSKAAVRVSAWAAKTTGAGSSSTLSIIRSSSVPERRSLLRRQPGEHVDVDAAGDGAALGADQQRPRRLGRDRRRSPPRRSSIIALVEEVQRRAVEGRHREAAVALQSRRRVRAHSSGTRWTSKGSCPVPGSGSPAVIATSSPGAAMPWLGGELRRSRRAGRGRSVSKSLCTAVTPKSRLSRRTVSIRGETASTGTFGPVGGDEAGGAAAVGRHHQRLQPEPVDGADGALGDRVGDVLGRLVGAA